VPRRDRLTLSPRIKLSHVLDVAFLTDVGRTRSHNEDSLGTELNIGLLVLADGMGGYKAGEVASGMATAAIITHVQEGLKTLPPGEIDEESGYARETLLLQEAVLRANQAIYEASHNQDRMSGMGTTVVAGLFYDNRMTIAHVGDSRVYRLREDSFEQMTKDHSLLQELIDRGFYTPEEAKRSGKKNVVTRALGVESEVKVSLQEELVKPGDIYLFCSDGLNDMLDDGEIHLIISTFSGNLKLATEQLVQMANDHGGQDNISVILVRPTKPYPLRRSWFSRVLEYFK
jgi:serine/threonine protein phosphatase PrpC